MMKASNRKGKKVPAVVGKIKPTKLVQVVSAQSAEI